MSLQEAFETFRRDLISRSRKRQIEIQQKAEQRQLELEARRQHAEILRSSENRLYSLKSGYKTRAQIEDFNQDSYATKRRMSIQEIKTQNRRLYEKLPEVQQRQKIQQLEEKKRLNRMKSSIYKKV